MKPTRHRHETHLTITELQLELEILKEKHGENTETNISEVKWISPSSLNAQPFVCLINPKYEETQLR